MNRSWRVLKLKLKHATHDAYYHNIGVNNNNAFMLRYIVDQITFTKKITLSPYIIVRVFC